MATFARTHQSISDITISDEAEFTLVLYRSDGMLETVDSTEMFALKDESIAIGMAMSAIREETDYCDVYHYGGIHGTAEYLDLTPDSWFSSAQVVYSVAC